jgi:hypothetical protein
MPYFRAYELLLFGQLEVHQCPFSSTSAGPQTNLPAVVPPRHTGAAVSRAQH